MEELTVEAMRELAIQAVKECMDLDVLGLVFGLLCSL